MRALPVALQAQGLKKAFGHVQALQEVTFDVRAGEILVILGDNGAGKSTLIKTLSGLYKPDAGTITVDNKPQHFTTPGDAMRAGIATVYQDLALVETRDVAANLYLGREFMRGPFVDRQRGRREAEQIMQQLGVKLPSVRVPVSLLSGGQRQAVAVARTLVQGANLIIMDEPTAALGVTESQQVLRLITDLRAVGKAVIVISHNLQQVWDIADRFLVMRLGRVAGVREKNGTTVDELVKLIVYGGEPSL
ncbi:MAG TPA: ATP-binding cassette domain-containing protein [Ktedonobacterales bacterium]|nr:ATP-binding cassette domain-containing protein [Ktedonobacterales bacterium]